MILLNKPGVWQPQYAAPANKGSALANGLSLLWLPSSPRANLTGGTPPTLAGNFQQSPGPGGLAYIVTNSANSVQWTVPTGLTAATILVLISTSGASSTYVPYKTNTTNVDHPPFSNGLVYSGAFAGARYVNGVAMPGGTSYLVKPYVVAARGSSVANSHATFVNGQKVGSGNQTFTLSSAITIAADGSIFSANQRTYLAAFWTRALSDDELYTLSANPWQLFQPRRIWVPVSAGGGGGPSLSLSASPLSIAGALSASGDLTITPAATLALSASPLAIAGTLATAGDLDYLLPALALSASPLSITGTLAPTGDLAYELPTLALSASPLALSGTLTPSGDIDYALPFALTASALAVSGTVSVSGDLSITDEIKLTLSASPLALAGALAVTGDLDYVVPTLVLSASPLALSGAVAVTGDPRGVVPFVLSAGTVAMSGAVSIEGDLEYSDRPIGGLDIEFELEPALWWQRKPKTLGNVKAKAKLAKVAKVIAKKAVEQVEKSAPEAQRKAEVRQAVAPMLPEMPGFDWKPVYEQAYSMALTAAIDAQMRQAEANQAAAREIERIRQLDEEDIAILVAMM